VSFLSAISLLIELPNLLTLQFSILDKGYLPFGDKSDFDISYPPGPGNLFYIGLLRPIVVLKFLTSIFLIVDTGYFPDLFIDRTIGYFPGPGNFNFYLFVYYNFPDRVNDPLFNNECAGYAPGPGFLFLRHSTKGPVIYIYYRPLPNPKPFLSFFEN